MVQMSLDLVAGGLAGLLGVLIWVLVQPERHCPRCLHHLPKWRRPRSVREMFLGGWHCPGCSARISRNGQLLP